jgi:hypothetical protein
MNCPECNADSEVVDSRPGGNGQRRRRACPSGHRWTTYEISGDELSSISRELIETRTRFWQGKLHTTTTRIEMTAPDRKPEDTDTALAIVPARDSKPGGLIPRSYSEWKELAVDFSKSSIIPEHFRGHPADTFVAMQFGAELGFFPMASLRHVYVVKGTPTLAAQAMHAVCLNEADCEYFERDDQHSERGVREVWVCKRKGRKTVSRGEFTMDDAKGAGLAGKDVWKSYPADMLENRAISRCARRAYPDRIGGIYTSEEARFIELDEVAPGEFAAPPPPPPAEAEPDPRLSALAEDDAADLEGAAKLAAEFEKLWSEIDDATTEPELEGLVASCKALKEKDDDLGDKLLARYLERRRVIRAGAEETK